MVEVQPDQLFNAVVLGNKWVLFLRCDETLCNFIVTSLRPFLQDIPIKLMMIPKMIGYITWTGNICLLILTFYEVGIFLSIHMLTDCHSKDACFSSRPFTRKCDMKKIKRFMSSSHLAILSTVCSPRSNNQFWSRNQSPPRVLYESFPLFVAFALCTTDRSDPSRIAYRAYRTVNKISRANTLQMSILFVRW